MSTVLTIERRLSGVLTDATTATLSDETGAFGILRGGVGSNGVVVVAAGTTLPRISTGVYQYDYGPLNLDPAYDYVVAAKFVYQGTADYQYELIQKADARRTLREIRRAVARKLGKLDWKTATRDGATTREVVCSGLVDDDRGASSYEGYYVYLSGGSASGEQGRVRKGGYKPSDGTLVMASPFSQTVLLGSDFELHARLPVLPADGSAGLNALINEALDKVWAIDRLAFTGVANQRAYSLADYPWLRDPGQIGRVLYQPDDATLNPRAHPYGGLIRQDGELRTLELVQPFATGETFWLEVLRPGWSRIKSGGLWGESTVGLVADNDETLADQTVLSEIALAYAYRELAETSLPAERDAWRERYLQQARKAATLKANRLPKLETTARIQVVQGGVVWMLPGLAESWPGRAW